MPQAVTKLVFHTMSDSYCPWHVSQDEISVLFDKLGDFNGYDLSLELDEITSALQRQVVLGYGGLPSEV